MSFLEPVLIVAIVFTTIGWMVHVIVDGIRRRQQLKLVTDFQGKLLERIGSAREFGEFLNTEGGAKFLASLSIEKVAEPQTRILRAVQSGVVLLSLGIGFLLMRAWGGLVAADMEVFHIFATICIALGLGLLVSALASYGLSRHFGLIHHDGHRASAPVRSA
jgi:hypothetical protein